MDVLEELSEIEKEEYLKNPTGLNALLVPIKMKIRLSNALSVKIIDGNEQSEIYYELGKSLDDITILKVSGPLSRLTDQEQKKIVIEAWNNFIVETLINDLIKYNTSIDLSDSKDDKKDEEMISPIPQELSISYQKQSLENLKSELLKESKEVNNSSDKSSSFTRVKRK